MLPHLLAAFLVASLPRPPAGPEGAPAEVVVQGPRIRLGDVAPAAPRHLLDIDVAPAPPAGRTMVVSRAALQDALRRAGADPGLVDGLPAYRTVRRAGARLTRKDLEARVRAAALERLPLGVSIERVTGLSDALLPVGDLEVDVTLQAVRRSTRATVTLRVDGRPVRTFPVALLLSGTPKTPQLKRHLPRGRVVRPEDVDLARTDFDRLPAGARLRTTDVVGKQLTRSVEPGRPLTRSSLREPPDVTRGARIELVAQGPFLKITRQVVTLEDGRVGRPIRVRTVEGRQVLQATLVAPHLARITVGGVP